MSKKKFWIWVFVAALVIGSAAYLWGRHKAASSIENTLAFDSFSTSNAKSIAEVVDRMQRIDLSSCPVDFQVAYMAHINAWELLSDVERAALAMRSNGSNDMLEAFVRGAMGDPFGKAREVDSAKRQLQADAISANKQIRETFQKVKLVALSYGVKTPDKQPE